MTTRLRFPAAFRAELARSVRSDWPLYALSAGFFLFGLIHAVGRDYSIIGMIDQYAVKWTVNFMIVGPFFAFVVGVVHIAWRMKGRKRLSYRTMVAPRRLARLFAGTLFLLTGGLVFTSAFSAIKTSFPQGQGFVYDHLHADIDKAMHFGVDPFHHLYAFGQHEWLLRIVELNYGILWFIICYFSLYVVMTSPRMEKIRLRFALTWLGSWVVVGTAMASTWLSAGPVYYGRVTGDTARFAEQTAFLSSTSSESASAHMFQEYLWTLYQSGTIGLGSGISAFPSMHVALATVVALYAWEWSRKLGFVAWVYVAFIVCSSVYLGWHYAIDGYASIVVVSGLYWALRVLMPNLGRLRWGLSARALPKALTAQIEKRA